jgi:hypothetical protein
MATFIGQAVMIGIVSFPFLMLAQRLDWFQSVRTFPLPNVGMSRAARRYDITGVRCRLHRVLGGRNTP